MPSTADIAAAVVAELEAMTLSQPIVPVLAYLPLYDLGEMDMLHVTVVPTGRTVQAASRTMLQTDHRIEIAVQQRIAVENSAACAPLLTLAEEIADALTGLALLGGVATWVKTDHQPLIAPDHLHELRQFTSLLAVTWRTWADHRLAGHP